MVSLFDSDAINRIEVRRGRDERALIGSRALRAAAALALAVLLAGCGGDEAEEAPPPEEAVEAAVEMPPPAAETGDGEAALEAWVAPFREQGFRFAYEPAADGAISDIVVESPAGTRWTASSANFVEASDGMLVLEPHGDQQLTAQLGDAIAWPVAASTVRVSASGAVPRLTLEFGTVAAGGATIDTFTVRETEGGIEIDLDGARLGVGAGGPLGSTIASLRAVVAGTATQFDGGRAVTLSALSIRWGLLDFAGAGTLTVSDDGTWSGLLEGALADPLALLDAFRAFGPLDIDAVAEVYAALLAEMADAEGMLPFALQITDGAITLLGEPRGLPDLALGATVPALGGGAAE